MILPIIQAPDERLKAVCAPVTEFDKALNDFAHNLTQTRYSVHGVGLAAPQVGVAKRVIALNPGQTLGYGIMVNPQIVRHGGNRTAGDEGCLSIEAGKKLVRVARWDTITVRFQTVTGEVLEKIDRGYSARVIQHEIDHLDGKLIA